MEELKKLGINPPSRNTIKARRKTKPPPTEVIPLFEVHCKQQLGGLLKHYYRKVA